MRFVVLLKPVPDTTGQERLGPDFRVDRGAVPAVINPNDEHALEAALRLGEAAGGTGAAGGGGSGAAGGADITLLTMAGPNATETIRKGLAMGAQRGVLVTDPALAGADAISTARVLAAAIGQLEFDLIIAGADTSDGRGGVVAAAIATILRLPYLSYAEKVELGEGTVRVRRISPKGYDLLEAPTPAMVVVTQAVGEPRYPSLKGIMAARNREIVTRSLADLGLDPAEVGGERSRTTVIEARPPQERAATRVVRAPADEAAREVVAFLAERRLI